MTKGYIKHTTVVPLGLLTTVLLSGLVLSSSIVSADNDSVVDQINITVSVSCTMTGTGMNTHNAEIANGTYTPDIGTTTLHAFCNDNEGFAIYAAGYTGNEISGTNSNKLVGTTASSNATIVSGIATTAGSPDISNWAMKLAITQDSGDTTGTNAFVIDSAPNVSLPSEAESEGYDVIIAAAGLAAHLAGVLAAHTTLPVIGVPCKGGALNGVDALYATVQMPTGIPVATVAIDGAANAAILACQMIAIREGELRAKLAEYKEELKSSVDAKDAALKEKIANI